MKYNANIVAVIGIGVGLMLRMLPGCKVILERMRLKNPYEYWLALTHPIRYIKWINSFEYINDPNGQYPSFRWTIENGL